MSPASRTSQANNKPVLDRGHEVLVTGVLVPRTTPVPELYRQRRWSAYKEATAPVPVRSGPVQVIKVLWWPEALCKFSWKYRDLRFRSGPGNKSAVVAGGSVQIFLELQRPQVRSGPVRSQHKSAVVAGGSVQILLELQRPPVPVQ